MRRRVLQSDRQQCYVHGLHDGVYDDRRYDDGSHGFESVQRVCGWVWRLEFCWHKWLQCMYSGHLQDYRWQCCVHGLHYGVYDDWRHVDGCHGAEPVQRMCGWVWRL